MEQLTFFWNIMYRVWPPCVRAVECFGFHNFRQKFLLGRLNANYNKENLRMFLAQNGFEPALLAWQDPGEVLSMRKVDKEIFQYHVRLFIDGEIRAHYEYTPESHPLDHVFEARFDPETEYFTQLLGAYLITEKK